jgi:hypothetical protein
MAFAEQRLGPERAKVRLLLCLCTFLISQQGIYAFQSLLEAGARLTFGSDSPVEDLNPIKGFYAGLLNLLFGNETWPTVNGLQLLLVCHLMAIHPTVQTGGSLISA